MSAFQSPITFATRELRLFLDVTWRDWSTTLIPGLIIALGATKRAALPISNVVQFIPWVACFVYFFNLSNQIVGIEEDRINKPDRPLPSGKVSVQGAKLRWALALFAFFGIAILNGTLLAETVTWVATTALLCLTPVGGHWFGKNAIGMTSGTWALLSGIYKTIAAPTAKEVHFFIVVAIWLGIAIQIQDLRDITGDTAVGRSTLPIIIGDRPSRWVISSIFLPLSCLVLWVGDVFLEAPSILSAAHVLLAHRVMRAGGARYDHKTYMIFTYVFCSILTLPIWSEL